MPALDSHDTHCCIDHGCKYSRPECPVANGQRKQVYLCEDCGLEAEGYFGKPERSREEQRIYINKLWEDRYLVGGAATLWLGHGI